MDLYLGRKRRAEFEDPRRQKRPRSEYYGMDEDDLRHANVHYLFGQVNSKVALKETAIQWLALYERDPSSALAAAINLLTKYAGADLAVAVDDLELDIQRVAKRLEDDADQEGKLDPPVWRFKKKPFRRRYDEFWRRLVRETKHKILNDEYFLTNLIDWVGSVSKSNVRAFRQAAVQTSFALMDGLIEAAIMCEDELDKCETRLERARSKPVPRQEIISNLEENQKEHQAMIESVHAHCESIFNLIFVRRYRDIYPPIRVSCMEALGSWMAKYPSLFLEDVKLKYVGWCLSDKDPLVRRAAVETIHKIYEDPDNIPVMANFQDRFKNRLLEMSKDIDNSVSASSINLASKMLKNDLLKTNDGDDIQSYIYDQDEMIRKAAASFIYHDSFVLPEDDDKAPEQIDRDDVLEVLAIFGNEMAVRSDHGGELETPANYLVSTMWNKLACLKSWGVMIRMLLHSEQSENELHESSLLNKREDTILDSNSETLLLYVILSCAQMAKGTLHLDSKRRKKSRHEQEEDASTWEDFLETFVPRVPEIFQIVQTDPKKVNALVKILRVIPCDEWALRKKKELFARILKLIQKVFQTMTDTDLLVEISETLSYFVHEDHAFVGDAQRCAFDLASQLRIKFMDLSDEVNFTGTEEERVQALESCLARMISLKKAIHIEELQFDKPFKEFLSGCISNEKRKVLCAPLLELASFDLWWVMCDTSFDDIQEEELESILLLKNYVLENLSYCITAAEANEKVVERLIDSLCEILIVLKPTSDDRASSFLNDPLSEEDMNSVLRVFANRFEALSDELEDESEEKVLTTITHCVRLCLSDPKNYGRFGALTISQLNRFDIRADDLIKHCQSVIKRNYGHQVLQDIQFEALRHIFEDNEFESGNSDRLESVAKTLSKVHGVDSSLLDFRPIIMKCLDYGMKEPPSFMDFLEPSIKPFIQRSQKKHKTRVFHKFREFELALPETRNPEDSEGWKMFDEFKSFLRETLKKGKYLGDDDMLDPIEDYHAEPIMASVANTRHSMTRSNFSVANTRHGWVSKYR